VARRFPIGEQLGDLSHLFLLEGIAHPLGSAHAVYQLDHFPHPFSVAAVLAHHLADFFSQLCRRNVVTLS